ncbi:hypothetical protein DdX_13714 [Ditylenchus destructor]|uniref:Uncharacterized protein n=1 Tax=Ditylenchus destructor TaxID=166010 RepID=A0AAD4MSD3_9BILA|nr:hypothetical protein DdX_13714 [Ditylenchus destructor]
MLLILMLIGSSVNLSMCGPDSVTGDTQPAEKPKHISFAPQVTKNVFIKDLPEVGVIKESEFLANADSYLAKMLSAKSFEKTKVPSFPISQHFLTALEIKNLEIKGVHQTSPGLPMKWEIHFKEPYRKQYADFDTYMNNIFQDFASEHGQFGLDGYFSSDLAENEHWWEYLDHIYQAAITVIDENKTLATQKRNLTSTLLHKPKVAKDISVSDLDNMRAGAEKMRYRINKKNNIGMTYVYYNGRYVEQPSTSHAQPLDESQFVDVAIKYAEQSSTSQAQALDESQFVDAELMFATEIAAVVMIIFSILFSIGLCFTGVYAIYIINTSVAIVMYCKVFYVHNCDFGVRCGNALGGAVAYSFLYMLVAMGFIVYFVRKPASIPSPYHIFLALLCLAFVVYQWYCIGLFYQDGQDHYRLWKARNCHNKYCTHTHGSNVPQQQWPIGKNQSRNFDPQTGSRTPYHKANPEMRTPGNQVNAVKIVENPMETYQNCNIYMHDANTNNATGTSSKSLNMDPEKGIQKSLEYPD